MTNASNRVWKNPTNRKTRKTHKQQIHEFLKWDHNSLFIGATAPEIARSTGLTIPSCVKRLSDLHREGKVEIINTRNGRSVYRESNGESTMTTPGAYKAAIDAYCDADTANAIYKFVKEHTL